MTAETSNILGKIPCLNCQTPVVLRANKNDLAYYGCSECGCQVLTRGRPADRALRAKLIVPAAPAKPAELAKREETKDTKPAAGHGATGKPATAGAGRDWW